MFGLVGVDRGRRWRWSVVRTGEGPGLRTGRGPGCWEPGPTRVLGNQCWAALAVGRNRGNFPVGPGSLEGQVVFPTWLFQGFVNSFQRSGVKTRGWALGRNGFKFFWRVFPSKEYFPKGFNFRAPKKTGGPFRFPARVKKGPGLIWTPKIFLDPKFWVPRGKKKTPRTRAWVGRKKFPPEGWWFPGPPAKVSGGKAI